MPKKQPEYKNLKWKRPKSLNSQYQYQIIITHLQRTQDWWFIGHDIKIVQIRNYKDFEVVPITWFPAKPGTN